MPNLIVIGLLLVSTVVTSTVIFRQNTINDIRSKAMTDEGGGGSSSICNKAGGICHLSSCSTYGKPPVNGETGCPGTQHCCGSVSTPKPTSKPSCISLNGYCGAGSVGGCCSPNTCQDNLCKAPPTQGPQPTSRPNPTKTPTPKATRTPTRAPTTLPTPTMTLQQQGESCTSTNNCWVNNTCILRGQDNSGYCCLGAGEGITTDMLKYPHFEKGSCSTLLPGVLLTPTATPTPLKERPTTSDACFQADSCWAGTKCILQGEQAQGNDNTTVCCLGSNMGIKTKSYSYPHYETIEKGQSCSIFFPTPIPTNTPKARATAPPTNTPRPTFTPAPTNKPTNTPKPSCESNSGVCVPSMIRCDTELTAYSCQIMSFKCCRPYPTSTLRPTDIPTRRPTAPPTNTPRPTFTPVPTQRPTAPPTNTPRPTFTPIPTSRPSPVPTKPCTRIGIGFFSFCIPIAPAVSPTIKPAATPIQREIPTPTKRPSFSNIPTPVPCTGICIDERSCAYDGRIPVTGTCDAMKVCCSVSRSIVNPVRQPSATPTLQPTISPSITPTSRPSPVPTKPCTRIGIGFFSFCIPIAPLATPKPQPTVTVQPTIDPALLCDSNGGVCVSNSIRCTKELPSYICPFQLYRCCEPLPFATPQTTPTPRPTSTPTPTLHPTATPIPTPTAVPLPPCESNGGQCIPSSAICNKVLLSYSCPSSYWKCCEPLPTITPFPTATPTVRPTVLPTNTPRPTSTPTPTLRPTATPRPTSTPTPTLRPTATPRPTSTPTPTLRPTATPRPTSTPTPTATPRPTPLPQCEVAGGICAPYSVYKAFCADSYNLPNPCPIQNFECCKQLLMPTPRPTSTPTPTLRPTATPRPTSTPTPTPRPTSTPTPTLRPTATPRPTSTPTPTLRPTATPRPTLTPTPTPRPTSIPRPACEKSGGTCVPSMVTCPQELPSYSCPIMSFKCCEPLPTMTPKPTITPTRKPTVLPTNTPRPTPTPIHLSQPTPTRICNKVTFGLFSFCIPLPSQPTPLPTQPQQSNTPVIHPTIQPTRIPSPTSIPTPTATPPQTRTECEATDNCWSGKCYLQGQEAIGNTNTTVCCVGKGKGTLKYPYAHWEEGTCNIPNPVIAQIDSIKSTITSAITNIINAIISNNATQDEIVPVTYNGTNVIYGEYRPTIISGVANNIVRPTKIIIHTDDNSEIRPSVLSTVNAIEGAQNGCQFAIGYDTYPTNYNEGVQKPIVVQTQPLTNEGTPITHCSTGRQDSLNIEIAGTPNNVEPSFTPLAVNLTANLMEQYNIPISEVYGHSEQSEYGKVDPGEEYLGAFRSDLRAELIRRGRTDLL